jgi:hypothetical protein
MYESRESDHDGREQADGRKEENCAYLINGHRLQLVPRFRLLALLAAIASSRCPRQPRRHGCPHYLPKRAREIRAMVRNGSSVRRKEHSK